MKVLITGSNGFIGKNLVAELLQHKDIDVFSYNRDTDDNLLDFYCKEADFVFNLAGINRPKYDNEFMEGNFDFAVKLLNSLKRFKNKCPVMLSSSIQALQNNSYGLSKRASEKLFFDYAKETGANVYVFRLPNVFGKWCKPNYNSVIATFCYNIANDFPIKINNSLTELSLVYIDDVLNTLLETLQGNIEKDKNGFSYIPIVHTSTLGEIVKLLQNFKNGRENLFIPNMISGSFEKKLYSTYLSYLPDNDFSYPLIMHNDVRGSFTEILKTVSCGQFSVNISRPGITKGNHWHHTKNEKFIVVKGNGLIRFRNVYDKKIIEYHVSGDKIEVVDVPPGYTHSIVNVGNDDLVTFMWCNECYDSNQPDTYPEDI